MNRKIYIIPALILATMLSSIAQESGNQLFNVGDKDLNFTVGLGSPWVFYHDYRTGLPPVVVSLDKGFRDDLGPGVLSIGVMAAATTYREDYYIATWLYDYGQKSTTLIGALRGTYHYQFIDKLDTYGGVHAGLRLESWKTFGTAPSDVVDVGLKVRPVFNLFAGAKYFISDNLFILGELGLEIAFINFGIGLKL